MARRRKAAQRKKDFSFEPFFEYEFKDFLIGSLKEIKLRGLYISHKFVRNSKGNENVVVFIRTDSRDGLGYTEAEDLGERIEFWRVRGDELWIEAKEHPKGSRIRHELFKRSEFAELEWFQYKDAYMDAHAGLPIDKYWDGKYVPGSVTNLKHIEGQANQVGVQQMVESSEHGTPKEPEKKEHGALQNMVDALARDFGCKLNQTVNKKIKEKMIEELERKGFGKVSDATLRVTLQRLSYSQEKPN